MHGTQFGPYTVLDLHARPDDGKGFELQDGWLVEVAASSRHNWARRTLTRILERAAAQAGSQAIVCNGGERDISTPAGVRRPDVFAVPREVRPARHPHYWVIEHSPRLAVQVLNLFDGTYTAAPDVTEGTLLEAVTDAGKPVSVSFDPAELLDF